MLSSLIKRSFFALTITTFFSLALAQISGSSGDLANTKKEFEKIARENFIETTKNICVNFWSAQEKVEALSKLTSISEHCRCIVDEMNFLASDSLATRLIEMQIQHANKNNEYLSDSEVAATVSEWQGKNQAANKICTEKAFRNRRGVR